MPIKTKLFTGSVLILISSILGSKICIAQHATGADLKSDIKVQFPVCDKVINIKQPPYSAKGDGVSDDTEALRQALLDHVGQRVILYFPAGTYLVSETIEWTKKNSHDIDAWGNTWLQGENSNTTSIRLKDHSFIDKTSPKPIMWCGGFGSADWFHNYIQDLTFDVGNENPAAIALQFYSNNSGAIRNCRFIAGENSGYAGLDLIHRDMNGPLLVKNCEIIGFDFGVRTGHAVNSQTFEHLTLKGQRRIGFSNEGQTISIRNLLSMNNVPAVQTYGTLTLIEGHLQGMANAAQAPAIINYNGGRLFLRDIQSTGYKRALADIQTPDSAQAYRIEGLDKPGSFGPDIAEYFSHEGIVLNDSKKQSLRIDVKDTPSVEVEPFANWANVNDFGADPTGENDSADAVQAAIDSGAATIFFPGHHYVFHKTVIIRGNVRHLLGVSTMIDYFSKIKPDFRIDDGASPIVMLEHFSPIHGGVEINTQRTIIFRSVSDCDLVNSEKAIGGTLFFEDFVTHDLRLNQQSVWARQLNVENEGTHISNDNGQLWVLGYKTERGGTLLENGNGAKAEILGGFSYTTTAGKLAPMFVNENSSIFAFFAEVCFNGDPFVELVLDRQKGHLRSVKQREGDCLPFVSTP